jgi:hypothetical protein
MTRTRLMLAGLIAGAMALGSACQSDRAAEREPVEETRGQSQTPPADPGGTTPPGTGGSGDLGTGEIEEPGTDNMIPDDYGGTGTQNPENPSTGDDDVSNDDRPVNNRLPGRERNEP